MNDLEKELEILMAIEETPLPPSISPVPLRGRDGKVIMSDVIKDYLTASGAEFDLDEQNKIDADKYAELLDTYRVPSNRMPRYVTLKEP